MAAFNSGHGMGHMGGAASEESEYGRRESETNEYGECRQRYGNMYNPSLLLAPSAPNRLSFQLHTASAARLFWP